MELRRISNFPIRIPRMPQRLHQRRHRETTPRCRRPPILRIQPQRDHQETHPKPDLWRTRILRAPKNRPMPRPTPRRGASSEREHYHHHQSPPYLHSKDRRQPRQGPPHSANGADDINIPILQCLQRAHPQCLANIFTEVL